MTRFFRITKATLAVSLLFLGLPVKGEVKPCSVPASTQTIGDIALKEIATGLRNPVHLTHAGDGSGRLFVVEQAGVIRIIKNSRLLPEPFLDIRDRVASGGEKGLLSVAFHPRYKEHGLFYVNYTSRGPLRTVVSRFKRKGHNTANPRSEKMLLEVRQPNGNHNGGQIVFGPDGYLYIGMGDGGSGNDPRGHGQNPNTLLGALLRIDVNRKKFPRAYGIPPDNPFTGKRGYMPEIWAYGLRNPWRFSFDVLNGRLYAADVGQNAVEEIDIIRKGRNYGWNIMEGDICTPGVNRNCDKTGLEPPIFTYPQPEGFSITGGFVYRGKAVPDLCGVYLFADYVKPRVWGLRYDGEKITAHKELVNKKNSLFDKVVSKLTGDRLNISSFGQDENLELYMLNHQAGTVLKIVVPGR